MTLSVLLVDDEPEFGATLAERLRLRGFEVEITVSGEEALARILQTPPSVVVLDLMMPGLDGLTVLRSIKADRPDIPVILLTGQGSTRLGIEGMKAGAVDFLLKPVEIGLLASRITEAADVLK